MYVFHFSPRGTTKKIAQGIAAAWGGAEERDLLLKPLGEELEVPGHEPVLVVLPVYAGRIPPLCREMVERLKGQGGPAVAVVAYGNRDYDDALLELCDLLESRGFHVVAAGAFIGQHSIFTQVAQGRPDSQDMAALADFGAKAKAAVERFDVSAHAPIQVKGNPAYRETAARGVPMKPIGNQNCIKCRACVARCPKKAIPADEPRKTDAALCISCGACIYICPVEARGYSGPGFEQAAADFGTKCAAYQRPEVFFAGDGALS